ncbi:hypothetical protein ACFVIM_01510 [Streptomyces sp. NPDC057638]|uniref:hypothetical protein n=1 Tax=Streptomyces sp. NPDC057638 TaxID=3346190 RepID=UPI0036C6CF3D
MTAEEIDRFRAEASREDYASMARLARALYGTGLGTREVLRQCYGVSFPEEVFVIADAGPWGLGLFARFTNQPWQLAVPPGRGGPADTPGGMAAEERRIVAGDPDLLPAMRIPAAASEREDRLVCYRLGELRAGRSTAFRLWWSDSPEEALYCGDSLLDVLHKEHARALRELQKEFFSPSNWGAGSVDHEEVEEAQETLERVRDFQRQVANRQLG